MATLFYEVNLWYSISTLKWGGVTLNKIRKYIMTTFATMLLLGFLSNINIVNADEVKKDELKITTINSEFEVKEEETIYGTEKQLSRINANTMKFIKEIAFSAHASSRDYGLYPSITIAQAVLESGSGESSLSTAPYYNLFGVKGSYNGNSVSMSTLEDDGTGTMYQIYANFKSYPSWEDSIRDHDELLRNGLSGYYEGAWRINARTPAQSARALQGRYATDTNYASKLMNIVNDYNLERFDGYLTERDLEWLNSDSLDPWELPVIANYIPEKQQTWASGYLEVPLQYLKRVKAASPIIFEGDIENVDPDLYYVKETLDLDDDFFGEARVRFKRNPEVGSIAIYKTENGDNEIVEKYAVVERVFRDKILISEGVRDKNGIQSIYREVKNELIPRFEFINVNSN